MSSRKVNPKHNEGVITPWKATQEVNPIEESSMHLNKLLPHSINMNDPTKDIVDIENNQMDCSQTMSTDSENKQIETTNDSQSNAQIIQGNSQVTIPEKGTQHLQFSNNVINSNKNPNSSTLDKLFKKARKEANRLPSSIAPNTSNIKKRPISQTSSQQAIEEDNSDALNQDSWRLPKRPVKTTHLSRTPTVNVSSKNRFEKLKYLPQETSFEHNLSTLNRPSTHIASGSQHTEEDQDYHQNPTLPSQLDTRSPLHQASQYATLPSQQETQNSQQQAKPKNQKPPPIYITGLTLQQLIEIAKSLHLGKNDFSLKQGDSDEITLHSFSLDNYKLFLDLLKTKKIKFFTYTPKNLKPKNLVLKGINGDFSQEEVLAEINDLKIENVEIIKVSKIQFSKNNPTLHYLVQLSHNSHPQNLTKINSLLYQKIRWETLKKKKTFQCTNCQRIGHSSSNCNLGYRCVKCSDKHEPGQCKLPNVLSDRNTLYCVNCEERGHPASYRGCPFFKFVNDLKKAQNKQKNDTRYNRLSNINQTVNKALNKNNINDPNSAPSQQNPIPTPFNYQQSFSTHSHTREPSLQRKSTWNPSSASTPLFSEKVSFNFNNSLTDMKNQIISTIQKQLSGIIDLININTSRINNICNLLQINNE